MPLEAVLPALKNPKAHSDADLEKSMARFGFTEPMLLDGRTGRLVAGHGRMEALRRLKEKGTKVPPGVLQQADGGWTVPIVVGWASRNDTEAEAYLLASNQLAIAGGWNTGQLVEMLRGLEEARALEGVGFSADALTAMLDAAIPPAVEEEKPVPSLPKESWVEPGMLFNLGGAHWLMCGDSTKAYDVDLLMDGRTARVCWTDPPWNLAYDGEESRGRASKGREIANDNLGEDFPQFCALVAGEIARVLEPGSPLYVAMSVQEQPTLHRALEQMGFHWGNTVIWRKDVFNVGRRDYHSQYEPIWYGWKEGAPRLVPVEDRSQSDVWDIPRPQKSEEHPTMKPVELVVRALKNSSKRGDICFEPFSGSGTTLMACEQTGRACRALELEPRYVQVALERWEAATGQKAQRVE